MSIGARSQSAKTYLEKHYTDFPDCLWHYIERRLYANEDASGNLEELIKHGLHSLRETLQQDKELTINNTSIGIVGPTGMHETGVQAGASFRILEGEKIDVYLNSMVPKEVEAPATAPGAPGTGGNAGDEDVQMGE